MAKVLQYALTLEGSQFQQAATRATVQTRALTVSTRAFNSTAMLATNSTRALGNALSLVGFSVAPRATASFIALTGALKALRTAAIAVGASMPALGLAVLGVVLYVATLASGIKTLLAQLDELKTAQATSGELRAQGAKLQAKLMDAMARGKIDKGTGMDAIRDIQNAETTGDMAAANKRAFGLVRPPGFKTGEREAITQYDLLLRTTQAMSLGGKERDRALLRLEMEQMAAQFGKMEKEFGFKPKDSNLALAAYERQRMLELEESWQKKDGKGAQSAPGIQDAGMLERLGFVSGSGQFDVQRRMLTQQERTANGVEKLVAQGKRGSSAVVNE